MKRTSRPNSLIGALVMVALAFGVVTPAQADDMAATMTIHSVLETDGVLTVSQTLTFDGTVPAQVVQRLATTRPSLGDEIFTYDITDADAVSDGTSLQPTVERDGTYLVITVDGTKVVNKTLEMTYRVTGATIPQPMVTGQDPTNRVTWRFLQGLNVGVRKISGTVELPVGVAPLDIDCLAGPPVAPTSCQTYAAGTFEALNPQFTNGPLGAGEVVELSFVVPASQVGANQQIRYRWSLDRAFSAGLPEVLAALAALLIGGGLLYWAHRTFGTDQGRMKPQRIAEFVPIAAGQERFELHVPIRPAEVGTLLDERVDPIDITATIIDLAQRGYLRIIELPRESEFALRDWTFERRGDPSELSRYEQVLVNALAPGNGDVIYASTISEAIVAVIPQVQEGIYAHMASEHYFVKRPDKVRAMWHRYALATLASALVIFFALVIFTTFGILGLVLVGLAMAVLWMARKMPRRTPKGTAALAGLQVLAHDLLNQNTDNVPPDDAYGEISRILPYAIVLGGADRWLGALAAADDDPDVPDPTDLDWYHAPENWQLLDLKASLDHFIMVIEAKLFRR